MEHEDIQALQIIRSDLVSAEGRLYDHVATTFRWLMATLFAANGGAIVALLSSQNLQVRTNTAALLCFATGLFFSILVGALSAIWGLRASIRLAKIRGKVDESLLRGVINDEIVPDLLKEKPNWATFVPSYVAGAAFFCLMLGIMMAAPHL